MLNTDTPSWQFFYLKCFQILNNRVLLIMVSSTEPGCVILPGCISYDGIFCCFFSQLGTRRLKWPLWMRVAMLLLLLLMMMMNIKVVMWWYDVYCSIISWHHSVDGRCHVAVIHISRLSWHSTYRVFYKNIVQKWYNIWHDSWYIQRKFVDPEYGTPNKK